MVANFTVQVTTPWGKGPTHTERYKCVAFGRTGAEVEQKLKPGQVVTCNGFMRTSEWNDGSGKENHQLICNTVTIGTQHNDVIDHSPPPKQKQTTQPAITAPVKSENRPPVKRKVKARSGKHSRKPRQTDFTALVADDPEPFNDDLPTF